MHFKNINIHKWQQFDEVHIDLHDRLTILTGSNGCGKTTLLSLLARHSGWNHHTLSTPRKDIKTGAVRFYNRFFRGKSEEYGNIVGNINYSNDISCDLTIHDSNQANYYISLDNQQPVKSFYIPSHRPLFRYQALGNIPTAKKDKQAAFSEVSNMMIQSYQGSYHGQSASFLMKSSLIGWAINGYGVTNNNKVIMPEDREQIKFYEGFQNVLRKILPESIGFKEFEIRNMEIVFVCNDGEDEFLLETASGGISALIDMAWQIYMYSTKDNPDFTVIIDEIENHLHPTMQRRILPDLLNAFPNARFIVSTHSPLVVGSVQDSNIFALTYNTENKVISRELDLLNEAKTAAEILDEVLGVSFTMPIWAEDNLNDIIKQFQSRNISKSDFSLLRTKLSNAGLERMIPVAIQKIMESSND